MKMITGKIAKSNRKHSAVHPENADEPVEDVQPEMIEVQIIKENVSQKLGLALGKFDDAWGGYEIVEVAPDGAAGLPVQVGERGYPPVLPMFGDRINLLVGDGSDVDHVGHLNVRLGEGDASVPAVRVNSHPVEVLMHRFLDICVANQS